MNRIGLAISTLALCCGLLSGQSSPVVKTNLGSLSGALNTSTGVAVFKGIRFAAPPVGDLRWREPQPPASWSGVRDATKFGASCMQRVHGDFLPWTREYLVQNQVSEDCLYLNVWTPNTKAKLPVLVFIPGGGFVEGSGEVPIYDGASLASNGLVVVTVNYRLGIFGFFAHPELTAESPHHSSGNYGLLDQIAALRWVQENISAFGGDASRVTVWGQSAGAFSVGALLASPLAKGLFQRAMADSGLSVAGFPMKTLRAAEQDSSRWAEAHHASDLKALRALPAEQLIGSGRFGPIVDGWFLPQPPNTVDASGGGNDVPVITGYQANDGMLSTPRPKSLEEYKAYVERQYGPLASDFDRLYQAGSPQECQKALQDSGRDRERVSMFLWAKERTSAHKSSVYTYFFDRGIPWPQHPEFSAFHSGELPYFFGNLKLLDRPWEPVDRRISEMTVTYIKNFAANGDPNGSNLPKWPAIAASSPETFEIGERIQHMPLADKARYDFWVGYFESQEAGKAPPF